MMLGFGVVFEIPAVVAFLAMVGLVAPEFLAKVPASRHHRERDRWRSSPAPATPSTSALMAAPIDRLLRGGHPGGAARRPEEEARAAGRRPPPTS